MIVDSSIWRDRQINGIGLDTSTDIILQQEQVMLNFLAEYPTVKWKWLGNNTSFELRCASLYNFSEPANGVVIFGKTLSQAKTSQQLVDQINALTTDVEYAYVGINRYSLIENDLHIELPDEIEQSIDTIMNYCNSKFKRLASFPDVDGNHMVAAHPMDCYGLCK